MVVPWDVVASTAGGAGATILGVVVGGLLGRRAQDRHWLRDSQATAYAAVLREYTRVEFELRRAYLQAQRPDVDWAPWGAALTMLSLVADEAVIAAAAQLAEVFLRVEAYLNSQEQPEDEWLRLRGVVEEAQMAFVNAARRGLHPAQAPLRQRLGGPPRPASVREG